MKVLLAPRWLALHLFALASIALCLVGARWQWDRAHRTTAEALPATAPVQIGPAGVTPGAIVVVSGTWEKSVRFAVPARRDGTDGWWALDALKPVNGDAIAVVRGWSSASPSPASPSPASTSPASASPVTVIGPFLPDERGKAAPATPDQGQQGQQEPVVLDRVDTEAMSDRLGYPVRTGWVALQEVQPTAGPGAPSPLRVEELPGAEVGISWRNAAYAVQWVAFAAFAAYFWFRFMRDEVGSGAATEVSGGVL